MTTRPPRPHTGRRRNDAARKAILDSIAALLSETGTTDVSVDEIAAAAGVSKQTIYRWWPSKGAVLFEAMAEWAQTNAPEPDTGSVHEDVAAFLTSSFAAATSTPAAQLLRAIVAAAQRDEMSAALLRDFTSERRTTLVRILDRGRARGEVCAGVDIELLAEQAFGVLWYRIAVTGAPVTDELARRLAASLCGTIGQA